MSVSMTDINSVNNSWTLTKILKQRINSRKLIFINQDSNIQECNVKPKEVGGKNEFVCYVGCNA